MLRAQTSREVKVKLTPLIKRQQQRSTNQIKKIMIQWWRKSSAMGKSCEYQMPLSCEYMHRVWRKPDVEVFPLIQQTLQLYCKLLSEKMNEKIFISSDPSVNRKQAQLGWGFLFLWDLGIGCVILLWHSLGLPYTYSLKCQNCKIIYKIILYNFL